MNPYESITQRESRSWLVSSKCYLKRMTSYHLRELARLIDVEERSRREEADEGLTMCEAALVDQGFVAVAMSIRRRTGCSLVDAKAAIDAYWKEREGVEEVEL